MQLFAQPSSCSKLASSHCSPESVTPSPQTGAVAIGSARVRDAVTVLRSIVAIFGAGDGAVAADRVDVGDDAQIVDGPTAEFEAAIALDFEANLNLVAAGEFTERNVVETPLFVFMVDGARVAHVAV